MNSRLEQKKVVLVFLGSKGGGAQVLYSILRDLEIQEIDVWICKCLDTTPISTLINVRYTHFHIPHSIKDVLNPLSFLSSFVSLLVMFTKSIISNNVVFVQIMPSPTDRVIDFGANIRENSIVRLIHDSVSHPGENWPTKRAISTRARKADQVIVFSKYVASQISDFCKESVLLCNLPSVHFAGSGEHTLTKKFRDIFSVKDVPVILFLGRIVDYKGIDKFLDELQHVRLPYRFVIAGEGKFYSSLATFDKVAVVNRWLSDEEFNYALNEANIVVFPYLEASQSGIIPVARSKSKIILSTTVGGLSEQLSNYHSAYIYPKITKFEIENVLKAASEFSSKQSNSTDVPKGREISIVLKDLIQKFG